MKKSRLYLAFILLVVHSFACNSGNESKSLDVPEHADSTGINDISDTLQDSVLLFLLDVSAKDFNTNSPSPPLDFRTVQFKKLAGQGSEDRYILCGQFMVQDKHNKEEWIDFAAIKTEPYEQWFGSVGASYCNSAEPIPGITGDLSAVLKDRFKALRRDKNQLN